MSGTAERHADTRSAIAQILSRPSFDAVEIFELLDRTAESNANFEELSLISGSMDDLVGTFTPMDRLLRKAVADLALGFPKHALRLIEAVEGRNFDLIRAKCWLALGKFSQAVSCFRDAAKSTTALTLAEKLSHIHCLCLVGKTDEAKKMFDGMKAGEKSTFQGKFVSALITETSGDIESAIDAYYKLKSEKPHSTDVIFRLAVVLDARGEDPIEIESLYRGLVESDIFHVGAAINYGLFLLDVDRPDDAETIFSKVLTYDPDNERVWLYMRDAQASRNMIYDEGRHKEDEKLRQILRLPISEFELSVRSRNCLSKMNVHTLGDLISKTEAELLAYKNFGETSLKEIKEILARKGLRLGMNREEVERKMRSPSQRLAALTVADNVLEQPLAALNLSVRSQHCLEQIGIKTVQELVEQSERDLLSSKNFGLTSLAEVKKKLASYGLTLSSEDML